jgi:hypothetical protein
MEDSRPNTQFGEFQNGLASAAYHASGREPISAEYGHEEDDFDEERGICRDLFHARIHERRP